VLDFGLAKMGERQMRPGSVILTQEGMVFGTPEFMSPEQAQGKPLTPASDIYSLAVILYEVLTGKLPFDAKSAMDHIQLHVTTPPVPLNQRVPGKVFPPLLGQVVDRALAKRPEDRFASAADFAAAMQSILQGAEQLPPELARVSAVEDRRAQFEAGGPAQAQTIAEARARQPGLAVGGVNGPASSGVAQRLASQARPLGVELAGPPRANVASLVAIAVAFLLLGIALAVLVMKLVLR